MELPAEGGQASILRKSPVLPVELLLAAVGVCPHWHETEGAADEAFQQVFPLWMLS